MKRMKEEKDKEVKEIKEELNKIREEKDKETKKRDEPEGFFSRKLRNINIIIYILLLFFQIIPFHYPD
jgi:hypothetical protein